jgi:ABC-2 type transport system permease protein
VDGGFFNPLSLIFIFYLCSQIFIKQHFWMNNKRRQSLIRVGLVAVILVVVNILVSQWRGHIDLTEDKRFTLTQPTIKQLKQLKERIFVRVLLDGEFPAGFKRLQKSTKDLLRNFHELNPNIDFEFSDPNVGSVEEINNKRKELGKDGIYPIRVNFKTNTESTEKYIYPTAVVKLGDRRAVVNLLESDAPGQNPEVSLNNSIGLLEYKFSNAIHKILTNERKNIVFLTGHDELKTEETADLEKTLKVFYNTGRFNLDSNSVIPFEDSLKGSADILVVAKPKLGFTEQQKFKLDQYVMRGGRIIWLIDRLNAALDNEELMKTRKMTPVDYPLNLEDQFYKYGFRVQPNMVLDMECSRIPIVVGQSGGAPQVELSQWVYFPIVAPHSNHPIVKSLDRVNLQFPSSIDTIRTKTAVKKTIVLSSSSHSRLQFTPGEIQMEFARLKPNPTQFNKGNQPIAVMLEGDFPSLFENRVTQEMLVMLQQIRQDYKPVSKPTKMLIVADGDIARNEYDYKQQSLLPLGFNRFENYKFANKDFLLNAVEYMLDDNGIIEARSKEVKLRLLDVSRAETESNFWRALNVGLPLLLLALFGWVYLKLRKKKYGNEKKH